MPDYTITVTDEQAGYLAEMFQKELLDVEDCLNDYIERLAEDYGEHQLDLEFKSKTKQEKDDLLDP